MTSIIVDTSAILASLDEAYAEHKAIAAGALMAGREVRVSVTVAGRAERHGSPARSRSACSVPGTRAGMTPPCW